MDKAKLKLKRAWLIGTLYFLLATLTNFTGNLIAGNFNVFDISLVLISAIPFFLRNNTVVLTWGVINAFLWTFLAFLLINASVEDAQSGKTSNFLPFIFGYSFVTCSLIASSMLIYYGFYNGQEEIQTQIAMND